MPQSFPPRRSASPARFQRLRGAYMGWWVAAAVGMVAFSRVAFFNPVLGVFIEPLEEEFGWSRATIAGAVSMGTLLGAVLAPLLGRFIDRHGGRLFMVGSIIVMSGMLMLLALVQEVWQFYLFYGVGRAIVTGVLDIAIAVTIANWFIRQRGRAMGLVLVGTRGAMAVMPLIILLFLATLGWRASWLALGVLVLVATLLPTWFLVKRRPEDMGLRPDGDPDWESPAPAATEGPSTAAAAPPGPAPEDPHWSAREAIRTRAFWLLLFGTSQLFLVGGAVNLTMVSHLQDNGLGESTAITVLTVWAAVGIVGGLIGGELRQRIPIRFALPGVILVSASALAFFITVDTVWMAYVFAGWHGLAFGAQLPLNQISFPDYFGRWSVGAIRGVTAPVQFGLNAVGPLLAGFMFDASGSYDLIYGVFVGLLIFGALLILASSPPVKAPHTTTVLDRPSG